MARIKQRHHKAREQTAGIKDLQHPLGDVIVARAVRLAAAQQVDQQHHNAEAERIVQRRGREILLAGDEAQAAEQRCDRHGHHAVQAAAVARYLKEHSASPETIFAVDVDTMELIVQAKNAGEEDIIVLDGEEDVFDVEEEVVEENEEVWEAIDEALHSDEE